MKSPRGKRELFAGILALCLLMLLMGCSRKSEKLSVLELEGVYGDWEVVDLESGEGLPVGMGTDELIGSVFQINKDEFRYNDDKMKVILPQYKIHNVDKQTEGTFGNTYIQVLGFYEDAKFFPVDNEKLVMFYKDSYYKMKRISNLTENMLDSLMLVYNKKFTQERQEDDGTKIYQSDDGYKMFYGDWVVTYVVDEEPHNGGFGENMIGTVFHFDKDTYQEDKTEYGKQSYSFAIIPHNELPYFPEMLTEWELGIRGNYYIHFRVSEYESGGDGVFLKDDQTMIMAYKGCYYELKRIRHIKDHKDYYQYNSRNNNYDMRKTKYAKDRYKMYYGEWNVKCLIGENQIEKPEKSENIIGANLLLDYGEFEINTVKGGQLAIKDPYYTTYIIPKNEEPFIKGMPGQREIGLIGDYFTFLQVDSFPEKVGFFIKDDETLIMFYRNSYYELERQKYKSRHKAYYMFGDKLIRKGVEK